MHELDNRKNLKEKRTFQPKKVILGFEPYQPWTDEQSTLAENLPYEVAPLREMTALREQGLQGQNFCPVKIAGI